VAFTPANEPPVAVHDVAWAELQVSVDAPPLATLVGFAVKVAAGVDLAAPSLLTVLGDTGVDAVGGAGFVVTGTDPDPPQAARSSAALRVIAGPKQRIEVLSNSRIMSAAGLGLNPVRTEAKTAGPMAHSWAASSIIPSVSTLT
jgi:hypothetical protein